MRPGAPPVLITYVALADIAGQNQNLFRLAQRASLAPSHAFSKLGRLPDETRFNVQQRRARCLAFAIPQCDGVACGAFEVFNRRTI
jgi:hypothetical protein